MHIILTSHAGLCQGAKDAYEMLSGAAPHISAVSLTAAGVDDFRARLAAEAEARLAEGPVLVLADLVGGTPYNESYALYLAHPEALRLVAGLSLPMLLTVGFEAADSDDLDSLYALALEAGTAGVTGADAPASDSANADDEDLF